MTDDRIPCFEPGCDCCHCWAELDDHRLETVERLTGEKDMWEAVALNAMSSLSALDVNVSEMVTSTPPIMERFSHYQRQEGAFS